jgi:hypothetical protein
MDSEPARAGVEQVMMPASDVRANIDNTMKQRTTITAEADDLEVLRAEARRLDVSLNELLSAAVADKAAEIQQSRRPRLGLGRSGGANLAEQSVADEEAPGAGGIRS